MADLKTIMERITKLLNVAEDSATTPEAAANYRAKAEQLMRDYRVEQEDLIASDPFSVTPIVEWQDLCGDGAFVSQYCQIMYTIARHTGIRVTCKYQRVEVGQRWEYRVRAGMVGYESDIRYAQFLWSAARLVFSSKLEPEVDDTLGEREMIYRLRTAGWTRKAIAIKLYGATTGARCVKISKIYEEECAARGEAASLKGRGGNLKVYRKGYADAFWVELSDRLRAARDAADTIGGALVMHGRKERVDEAFYTEFPELRPSTEVAVPSDKPVKARKVSKADRERWFREQYSPSAIAGKTAGRAAAGEVEMDRVASAKRVERGSTTLKEFFGEIDN